MRLAAGVGILLVAACSRPKVDVTANKAAGAAVAAGFGVAAAGVYRAATGSCWADCRPGLRCDHASGMCVPLEPSAAKHTATSHDVDGGAPSENDGGADAGPCRGLCLAGERCAIRDGVADCIRPEAPAAP
jgi:hypothetical protein